MDERTTALFDAVYDAPDDDSPRRELAVHLAAMQDPRGEFISLQLLPSPSAVERKRASALLKQHGATWLEPLQGALRKTSVKWARGFPVEGHLALQPGADDARLFTLRPLATLRTFDLEPGNVVLATRFIERIVFEAPLRHLRGLRGLRRSLLPRLLTTQPAFAIEVLRIPGEGGGGIEGERAELAFLPELHAAFADGTGLPNLRDLTLSFAHDHGRNPAARAADRGARRRARPVTRRGVPRVELRLRELRAAEHPGLRGRLARLVPRTGDTVARWLTVARGAGERLVRRGSAAAGDAGAPAHRAGGAVWARLPRVGEVGAGWLVRLDEAHVASAARA
jgi:hypothetical protein